MGEARRRLLAAQRTSLNLTAKQGITLMQLELACHMLSGIGSVLEACGSPDASAELGRCFAQIQAFKQSYIADAQKKLVIAQPGDVPPVGAP